MSHPTSCANPDTCPLSYREHLLGIGIAASATPSRAVNRTPGLPDEPITATHARQERFDREGEAFRQLTAGGVDVERLADAPRVLKEMGG